MVDVLSKEASMLLSLWDALHPEWGQWRYLEDRISVHWEQQRWLEESFFAPYIESMGSFFPSAGNGRKGIPLFQLAAELVVTRIFAPGTPLGEALSWETHESLWSPLDPPESEESESYADEWVETLRGWEEVPKSYSTPPPGGMSALRILAAFGSGKFVESYADGYQSRYKPFEANSYGYTRLKFRYTGKRGERICDALVGGSDFGVRSSWIRHLALEVDSHGAGPMSQHGPTSALLFYAHLELAGHLKEVVENLAVWNWPFEKPTEFGDDVDLSEGPF